VNLAKIREEHPMFNDAKIDTSELEKIVSKISDK